MSCIVKGVSGVRLPPKTQKHVGEGRRPLPEKCHAQKRAKMKKKIHNSKKHKQHKKRERKKRKRIEASS